MSHVVCRNLDVIQLDEDDSRVATSALKLFSIELSKYADLADDLLKCLTSIERQRAERFLQIKDRERFIICRSILKFIIAKETGMNISEVSLANSGHGKPYFPLQPSLFFNLSHSGGCAIIGIGDRDLGVDIESVDRDFDFSQILSNVFNDSEIQVILDAKDRSHAFYKFWTRKEAIVKAVGKGIDDDLPKISVMDGVSKVDPALVCGFKKVRVFSFDLNDGYVAALALTDTDYDLKTISFCPLPSPAALKRLLV